LPSKNKENIQKVQKWFVPIVVWLFVK
jgi:hypothetical protein